MNKKEFLKQLKSVQVNIDNKKIFDQIIGIACNAYDVGYQQGITDTIKANEDIYNLVDKLTT